METCNLKVSCAIYIWKDWYTISGMFTLLMLNNTVKPAHVVTSIKQSPVLKCHIFFALS